jgi:tetratricopeptide (TPR) repeat protein
MRIAILLGWLMIPVLALAYHYGPGQEQLRLDDATILLGRADQAAASKQYAAAIDLYDKALATLPKERTGEIRRVRLERAKAQLNNSGLEQARDELGALVEEMNADPSADPKVLAGARETLANAQYYMTWLMRLEGLGEEDWGPEIEASRQNFRALAEAASAAGDDTVVQGREEDLESAIRLARMGLDDLQGLALPGQCQGCKSGKCNSKKPGKKPGKEKPKDSRGASDGPPPDNSGQ